MPANLTAAVFWLNTTGGMWGESVRQAAPLTVAFVALVWLVCRIGARRLSPSVQSWLWWMACLKIVLCFACIPLVPVGVLPQRTPQAVRHLTGLGADTAPTLPALTDAPAMPDPLPVGTETAPHLSPIGGIYAIWLAGLAIVLVRVLIQAHALRRICRTARDISDSETAIRMRQLGVRMGLSIPPRLAVSRDVSAPLVCGSVRPIILLPETTQQGDTRAEETEMILAHELAHVRRGDLWLGWVPWATRAVLFWLPWGALLPVRGWERAREAACDLAAVRVTGAHPDRYCRLLLDVVGTDGNLRRGWVGALGATEAFHTLHGRIEALQQLSKRQQSAALIGLACFPLLLPLLLMRPVASTTAPTNGALSTPQPMEPVADVPTIPAWDIRIGGNDKKRYVLTGARITKRAPAEGYGLLVVLPGGGGGTEFSPFVRRVAQRALGPDWIVAELVAPMWDKQQVNEVVWPTRANPWPGMRFSTEDLVRDTIQDVQARILITPRRVHILGWASGGHAAAAAIAAPDVPVQGGFVAMSRWHDWEIPADAPKDRSWFVLHPRDVSFVPMPEAQNVVDRLKARGAKAKLVSYSGGYGWHGDVYAQIRQGMAYLDKPQ